jgi:hypothetical protein
VNSGDHAADRAAGQFDGTHVDRHRGRRGADDPQLRLLQRPHRAGGQGEQAPAAAGQFDRVAGELAYLLGGQVDDRAAGLLNAPPYLRAAGGVGDRGQADHGELGADAHQDVGVIDGPAGRVHGVEQHRLVVELGAEPFQRDRAGAVGPGRVDDPVDVVHDHGAGSLEKDPVALQAGVVDDLLDAVLVLEHLQDVGPAFALPAGRVHRVDRDPAAGMRREPVVREHRVGRRRGLVLEQVYPHACLLQPLREAGRFGVGRGGDLPGGAPPVVFLEAVVVTGVRVGTETVRPDEYHRAWCLNR